ncbi:hypothetical protein [Phytohabitans suffuscus]
MRGGRRVAIKVAVVGLGLAGLAVTVPTFAAAPEHPAKQKPAAPAVGKQVAPGQAGKCCLVELDGPARTVTAGGAPARFDLVVSRFDKGCTQTRRTITVRLDGLATEHVRLERVVSGQLVALRDTAAGADTVEAVDPLVDSQLICGADTEVAASYRIAFLDGAPSGRAELIVSALAVNGKVLDSARTTTVVVEAMSTTAPARSTPPTAEAPVDETTAPPPQEEEPTPPSTPEAPAAVARPPLRPSAEVESLSTTLLTSSIVFALSAMLLVGVLWRLRRTQSTVPAADEVPTATLPPGVGAELARLTEDRDAAGPTRPAAP